MRVFVHYTVDAHFRRALEVRLLVLVVAAGSWFCYLSLVYSGVGLSSWRRKVFALMGCVIRAPKRIFADAHTAGSHSKDHLPVSRTVVEDRGRAADRAAQGVCHSRSGVRDPGP